MPQLWIETWVGQYFWLLIVLFFFHYFMVNQVIPTIATLIKIRKTLGKETQEVTIKTSNNTENLKILLPNSTNSTSSSIDLSSARSKWLQNVQKTL